MTDEHKQKLRSKRKQIVENLDDIDEVLDILQQVSVMQDRECSQVSISQCDHA